MRFLDRTDEQHRLQQALQADPPTLAVVYGRRRCGKSTLLQHVLRPDDIYFLADQRESALSIQAFAREADRVFPGFGAPQYASWSVVIESLAARADRPLAVFLDEFPYLVQNAPELPSVLQRQLDTPNAAPIHWVICGSSRRMMHGLVLAGTAPLYGRAREILNIRPLSVGWLPDALGCTGSDAVAAWSVWGGVPRYWELAEPLAGLDTAIERLLLDRNGVLREEPGRLLADDMRSSVQSFSLLSVVANGAHRMAEIAARMGRPAGSLTRPIGQLLDLGYLCREIPFGESPRKTRHTLYRVADPFLRFFFRFIEPNRSALEVGAMDRVRHILEHQFPSHVAAAWEELARASAHRIEIDACRWNAASRWWGRLRDGRPIELDVVAESVDGQAILLGEAKTRMTPREMKQSTERLLRLAPGLPFVRARRVVVAHWMLHGAPHDRAGILSPEKVLRALR